MRPSFADKDKRPRVRRKKPARERRAGEQEETAPANCALKANSVPRDAIAAQGATRETYHCQKTEIL